MYNICIPIYVTTSKTHESLTDNRLIDTNAEVIRGTCLSMLEWRFYDQISCGELK